MLSPAVSTKPRTTIGVDVGGTSTKAGIVDSHGKVLARAERPTERSSGTKGIIAVVEELLELRRDVGVEVIAVGVGAAGFVDFATGTVTFSPNLVYDDPHIAAALESRVALPVAVDNDANAAAWGERAFGACRGLDHLVLLTLGTGIGSGIVADGRPVRGATGTGAELGHMIIDPDGPECSCGLRGCLEQFASGKAIMRMAREAARRDPSSSMIAFAGSVEAISGEDVAKAAREYDEPAREVLRRAGVSLAIGLSNIVNVFDPEAIVLGGSVVKAGEPFLGVARDHLARMLAAQRRRPTRLDVTSLGNDAGIVGAAALALEETEKL